MTREEKRVVSKVYQKQWDSPEVEVEKEYGAQEEMCQGV